MRIIVADDNQDAADSLMTLLELDGHQVRTTQDGRSAFGLAAASPPDVMLLDIGMPNLNGYELSRKIRGEQWGAPVKLIALSGWGQGDDRRQASLAGFDHHLTKPVAYEDLRSLLARIHAGQAGKR